MLLVEAVHCRLRSWHLLSDEQMLPQNSKNLSTLSDCGGATLIGPRKFYKVHKLMTAVTRGFSVDMVFLDTHRGGLAAAVDQARRQQAHRHAVVQRQPLGACLSPHRPAAGFQD